MANPTLTLNIDANGTYLLSGPYQSGRASTLTLTRGDLVRVKAAIFHRANQGTAVGQQASVYSIVKPLPNQAFKIGIFAPEGTTLAYNDSFTITQDVEIGAISQLALQQNGYWTGSITLDNGKLGSGIIRYDFARVWTDSLGNIRTGNISFEVYGTDQGFTASKISEQLLKNLALVWWDFGFAYADVQKYVYGGASPFLVTEDNSVENQVTYRFSFLLPMGTMTSTQVSDRLRPEVDGWEGEFDLNTEELETFVGANARTACILEAELTDENGKKQTVLQENIVVRRDYVETSIETNPLPTAPNLTETQYAAISNANSPSSSNPFATMNDIAGGGISDAPSNGSIYARQNASWVTISIPSLSGYATESFVTSQGYITSSALAGYATESWVGSQGFLTSASLTGYATESWVSSQGYLTSASLAGYATESWVGSQGFLTSSSLTGYATESWVSSQGYLTSGSLTGYATESWVSSQGFGTVTEAPSDGLQYARKNGAWAVVEGDGVGISDAPSDGSEYVRKDGAWAVATSGGGSTISDISNGAATTLNNTPNTNYQTLIYDISGQLAWSNYAGVVQMTNGYATSVNTPLDGQFPMYYSNQIIWSTLSFATEGFVTSQGYATESFVTSQGYITSVPKPSVTVRTASSYTLTSGDAENAIVFTSSSGNSLYVPQNYVVPFPIGTRIYVCNLDGSNHVSVSGLSDSTETAVIYGNLNAIQGMHTLLKTDTNEWFISV